MCLIVFAFPVWAENGMNSPYTRYGFGQLSTMGVGVNRSMGGTGIGLHNSNQINLLNPASYAAVDTLTFLMDIGMSLHNTNFEEDGVKRNARNTTFDHLTMQFRLMPRLGMTIGVVPFSNIGYNFSNTQVIRDDEDGVVSTTNRYYGDGGCRLGLEPLQRILCGGESLVPLR